MPGTVADSVDFLDEDGCDLIVARLQFQARQVRYWKRKAAREYRDDRWAAASGKPVRGRKCAIPEGAARGA